MEAFTVDNSRNKNLMWKYKETFSYPDLGSIEHEGELLFVQAIVEDNPNIRGSRYLHPFINALTRRIGHEENFRVVLEICKHFLSVDSLSQMKNSIVSLILEKPNLLKPEKAKTL